MHSNSHATGAPVSRRGALALATGGLASFVCGNQALRSMLGQKGRGDWNELSATPAQAVMTAIPRRLSHPARHTAVAHADWQGFKRRFLANDGRVFDSGNGGISHSEGQGWAMLLAVAFDDMATFDLVRGWTQRNLQIRHDALHAWRYVPQSAVPVSDHNNATDGDLFVAAALLRAAWRWQRHDLANAARDIASDILGSLVQIVGGRTILLPGIVGFARAHSVTVNPSYYILPVFEELATVLPSPAWQDLRTHGVALLTEGRYGPWRLPPDWLEVDRTTGKLRPDPERPARFSYDAIRVPLWLAWAGAAAEADAAATDGGHAALRDFVRYWRRFGPVPPAWIDVMSSQVAPYPAPSGMVAIGDLALGLTAGANDRNAKANEHSLRSDDIPAVSASIDYYSAALTLLSRCVWQETCEA
jgi:endoglucanase